MSSWELLLLLNINSLIALIKWYFHQFRKNLYSLVDKITNEVDMNAERFILLSPFPIHTMRFEGDEGNVFDGIDFFVLTISFVRFII